MKKRNRSRRRKKHGRRQEAQPSTQAGPSTKARSAQSAGRTPGTGRPTPATKPSTGRVEHRPWWERTPGRLEYEVRVLEASGIKVEVDQPAFRQGTAKFLLTLPEGHWLSSQLEAVFPDEYPYFRPEVSAPDAQLPFHQNPFHHNLCLLPRGTDAWMPTDTLAGILGSQLEQLRKSLNRDDAAVLREAEVLQGEPVSDYYKYEDDSVILIDSEWELPAFATSGELEIVILERADKVFRGIVRRVSTTTGVVIGAWPHESRGDETLRARWVRLETPLLVNNPQEFFKALNQVSPVALESEGQPVQVIAAVFPEQVRHDAMGDGWLFVVRRRAKQAPGFRPGMKVDTALIRAGRLGVQDLSARFPDFALLRSRGIAVIGLGCVGAPSLIEFARAGIGRLAFLDNDRVDAGSVVRWPFGLEAIGRLKPQILLNFIQSQFPWVRKVGVDASGYRIGGPSDPKFFGAVEKVIERVDLIYDATAELGIQHFLSDLARQRGLPYVCVSSTPGASMGMVACLDPRSGVGCWRCLQAAMFRGDIPTPTGPETEMIQPAGCNHSTYIGANYDLMEIALQGVRVAIATLLATDDPNEGYSSPVHILELRQDGRRIPPGWKEYALSKDPECPACGG